MSNDDNNDDVPKAAWEDVVPQKTHRVPPKREQKNLKKGKPRGAPGSATLPKATRSDMMEDTADNISRAFKKRDINEDIEPLADPKAGADEVHISTSMPWGARHVGKRGHEHREEAHSYPVVPGPAIVEMTDEERKTRAIIKTAAYLAAGYNKPSVYSRIMKEFKVTPATVDKYYKAAMADLVPTDEETKNKLRAHIHGMSRKLFKIAVDRKDVKGGVAILDRLSKLFDLDMTPGPTQVVNVGTMQIADMRGDIRKDDFLDRARKVGINTDQAEKLLVADEEDLVFDNADGLSATSAELKLQYGAGVAAGLAFTDNMQTQVVVVAESDEVSELQRYHQEQQGVRVVADEDGKEKIVPLFPTKDTKDSK